MKNQPRFYILSVLSILSVALVSCASVPVLDQEQPLTGTIYSLATSHWQSFTPAITGNLARITINPWWENPDYNYTLEIFEGDGVDGEPFYTQSGIMINNGTGPEDFTIKIKKAAQVEAGTKYTWRLTNTKKFQLVGYNWSEYGGGRSDYAVTDGVEDADYYFKTFVEPVP